LLLLLLLLSRRRIALVDNHALSLSPSGEKPCNQQQEEKSVHRKPFGQMYHNFF
jgi:hypothetical protein